MDDITFFIENNNSLYWSNNKLGLYETQEFCVSFTDHNADKYLKWISVITANSLSPNTFK